MANSTTITSILNIFIFLLENESLIMVEPIFDQKDPNNLL